MELRKKKKDEINQGETEVKECQKEYFRDLYRIRKSYIEEWNFLKNILIKFKT